MDIVILQTADPCRYKPMLEATARTALEYCRRQGHRYESYIGIKRGYFPWHATFNRMFQFQELIERGFRGWAVYMDADAYINDLDFDLASYLGDLSDRAGVLTTIPGAARPWEINAGVVLLNLGHEHGRAIANRWLDRYLAIGDSRLREMGIWTDHESDQSMLYEVLDGDAELRGAVHFESSRLLNSHDARFIRQFLRAFSPDLDKRTLQIERITDGVLGREEGKDMEAPADLSAAIVAQLYQAILERSPDATGLASYVGHVRHVGLERGIGDTAQRLLASQEYRQRAISPRRNPGPGNAAEPPAFSHAAPAARTKSGRR